MSSNLATGRQVIPMVPSGPVAEKITIVRSNIFDDIPDFVGKWNSQKIVLVISKTLAKDGSTLDKLKASFGDKLAATKIGVGNHSPYDDVIHITQLLQQTEADLLICIGSSSYSDASKIARLLAPTLSPDQVNVEGMDTVMDTERGTTKQGSLKPPKARLILVPCTLSASEYNPVGSASHPKGKKEHFGDSMSEVSQAADVILLDPDIVSSVSSRVWLESGARAVDHCIEAMVSKTTQPEGVKVAQEALADLVVGLCKYKTCQEEEKPDPAVLREAISACQEGSRLAISTLVCYDSKFGPSHAMGHQLGSVCRVPHGLTSCVCLHGVLRYEARHPDSKFWDSTRHNDVLSIINKNLGWTETEAPEAVEKLYRSLGLPTRLNEVGVESDEVLEKIARNTLTDVWMRGEPQMTNVDQVLEVLRSVK